MNPLMEDSKYPFEAIDFNSLKVEHFIPALKDSIIFAKDNYLKIKQIDNSTFKNTIEACECATDRLDIVVEVFYALHSAHCTDELTAIAEEFNNILTEFNSDIALDIELFSKINTIYNAKSSLGLSRDESTLLEKTYKYFTRNGALLEGKNKEKLRAIDQELAKLSLNFSENIRKEIASFKLVISDEKELIGMPAGVIEAAAETAKSKGMDGQWVFTLEFPSYMPFMQYCQNRKLRKEMWLAGATKGNSGEFDNRENILKTLRARKNRASLLGYKDHASFVLEERMAKTPQRVLTFVQDIITKGMPQAKLDYQKLVYLKKELTGDDDFRKYDDAFYKELLKKKELDFDDEVLRPYFKLENVLKGIFEVAYKLYGVRFIERNDIPKYHKDVVTYEVQDENQKFVGLFYGDYFPRAEKRSGAWMTTFRNIGLQFGEEKRPFVCNVCNFTKPTASKPSLLTLNEVLTLFHEFGHGLHGLLGQTKYKSISGTNVHWDFVELPSQIMENWVFEKECLDLFAVHYETGEKISEQLMSKIKKSNQFLEGLATMRQMSFSQLDMKWHLADPEKIEDIIKFEQDNLAEYELYPEEDAHSMSCAFGHIFSGGYSAGYYSYKWAEVLDADAFAYFQEEGIFNKDVAKSFKENILEKGGSEDPMKLFVDFRGREPRVDHLLKRGGLL